MPKNLNPKFTPWKIDCFGIAEVQCQRVVTNRPFLPLWMQYCVLQRIGTWSKSMVNLGSQALSCT